MEFSQLISFACILNFSVLHLQPVEKQSLGKPD